MWFSVRMMCRLLLLTLFYFTHVHTQACAPIALKTNFYPYGRISSPAGSITPNCSILSRCTSGILSLMKTRLFGALGWTGHILQLICNFIVICLHLILSGTLVLTCQWQCLKLFVIFRKNMSRKSDIWVIWKIIPLPHIRKLYTV